MNKTKYNNGCINIFRFLMLLYEDKAYYKDVVDIFKNDLDEKSDNTIQVILNKAINALKVFGIKVAKKKNVYKLISSMYSLNYTLEDLKSIAILISATENFPDKEIEKDVFELLTSFTLRMDSYKRNQLNILTSNYDFSFYYKNLKEQINDCKALCKSQMKIIMTYLQNGKEITATGFAKEVTYDKKTAYLHIYNTKENLQVKVALPNILKLKTDPIKNKKMENATSVTFKLTGRLAKIYKLKDGEYSPGKDENGDLIIINRNEPLDHLFARLMRYSNCCTIIRPAHIKKAMQELIISTLEQYKFD